MEYLVESVYTGTQPFFFSSFPHASSFPFSAGGSKFQL
jgi:hypothetical protein